MLMMNNPLCPLQQLPMMMIWMDSHSTDSSDDVGSDSECSQVSNENRNVKRVCIDLNGVMTWGSGATNQPSELSLHHV